MSIDEYLQQNINSEAIKKAQEFMESSHYSEIQKIVESDAYKMAQEALKMRDSLIHQDTLAQIERMQEQIESSSFYTIPKNQLDQLKSEQEAMQKMLRSFGITDD